MCASDKRPSVGISTESNINNYDRYEIEICTTKQQDHDPYGTFSLKYLVIAYILHKSELSPTNCLRQPLQWGGISFVSRFLLTPKNFGQITRSFSIFTLACSHMTVIPDSKNRWVIHCRNYICWDGGILASVKRPRRVFWVFSTMKESLLLSPR